MARNQAIFAGLVFNEAGQPAEVTYLGDEPHYVILDGDFRRHVPAETIDRQVLGVFQEQIQANQREVTEGAMKMLGQEDLFTKAMIDASIRNMDQNMERLRESGLPEDARAWLGMLGLRVVVDVHGQVIDLSLPSQASPDDEE